MESCDIPLKEMCFSTIPLGGLTEENEQPGSGTSTTTINYEYSGNISLSFAQNYPSSVLDTFVEVKATVDMFLEGCALKKVPGPEHKDKVLVHDLSVLESTANKPCRLRTSCDNWEIGNLIKSDDTDILIRMVFVEIDTITVEGLRELGHHYSIPARFWGSNSNGDFGHRTLSSGLDEITYITWLEILTKPVFFHEDTPVPENDGSCWYRPSFSFKWQYCGLRSKHKYKLVMFCLDSCPLIQERLAGAMKHTDSQLILKDPYFLYCLISSQWYDWNLDAYFRLRSQLVGIERRATSTRLESFEPEFEPNFPTLHKLARDIIQMAEVSQSAIFVMERLVHEHEHLSHLFRESADVYSRVEATLNERLTLFKGTLASYEALGKRLTNLINFVRSTH
ncbi:uncharacterized protein LAJ45_05713 [Morchella importuna]|uniref:uncharacterized protein n=1 Tax=Morchella importuna TaxID=1174673 RepID=UPI001E8D65EB|nr:uncharacterized protein LAJ45_05713 [Morchella importuna]KAH8150027.1 hypothetical protein LAJ45_05713 [Morchella importuna]